jgi:hypothetical protein
MAATDNIIGMVIIVSVLLIGGLLLQTNQLTQTTISFENNQDIYEQQKLSRDVESILQVTEPVSKLPLSRIISNIPYTNNGVGTIYGVDFNQIKYVESVFDSIYGKGNYFVELTPLVSKVRIIFVIDGSSSMYNDLDTITKIIPRILTNFKDRNYNVVDSRAYVLLQGVADNQVKANELTNLNKASDITPDNIIGANNSCTNDSSNKGVYNKYFKNELKNSSSDYFVGYDLYTNALNFRNISPDCNALFNNKIRGQHYEDWATGTLFAAMDIERKSTTDLNDPTMTIIVPVSDEIASGSEADSCYDQTLSPLERSRCELCTADTNRFDRANKLISFAVDKFEEENFDYIIFPIAIKPENTVPDKTDFCNKDGNECTTSSCFDCCDNTHYCEECKRVGDKAGVHNNQTVIDEMLNEMEKLANATGGEVIDLTHGYNDENDFLNNFLNSIEKAESTIKIGEEKNGEKIVITHLLPTSRNTFINAKIGLYNNVDKKEINDVVDIQNIPPVIDFYYSPKIGVIKNEVGFNVTLDARNSFDPEGEELNFEWKKEGNTISTREKDSIVINTPGDHNFELLVSDQKGGKSLQKFSIKATVNNTKARLFFVPVNWSSSSEIFYEYVNYQANKFLNQISC